MRKTYAALAAVALMVLCTGATAEDAVAPGFEAVPEVSAPAAIDGRYEPALRSTLADLGYALDTPDATASLSPSDVQVLHAARIRAIAKRRAAYLTSPHAEPAIDGFAARSPGG